VIAKGGQNPGEKSDGGIAVKNTEQNYTEQIELSKKMAVLIG